MCAQPANVDIHDLKYRLHDKQVENGMSVSVLGFSGTIVTLNM